MTMVNLELNRYIASPLPRLPLFNVQCSDRHDFEPTRPLLAVEGATTECSSMDRSWTPANQLTPAYQIRSVIQISRYGRALYPDHEKPWYPIIDLVY